MQTRTAFVPLQMMFASAAANGSCASKSLHRRLADSDKREGVSLNTLVVTLLAEGLGERTAQER